MGYFHDPEFQSRLVAFLCKDRNFLKRMSGRLEPKDFEPRRGEGLELYVLATLALDFWKKYREPIGGMLRTEVLDYIREKHPGDRFKRQLLLRAKEIRNGTSELVAVDALERKVLEYKNRRVKQAAVQQLISLQEEGKLTDANFMQVFSDASRHFSTDYRVIDYMEGLEQRIARREKESSRKWPVLFIDPLDKEIRVLCRGTLGLCLAKYKVGKSVFLLWVARAYALQSHNVLYFTLEDPETEVTNRLDGLLTHLTIRRLDEFPRLLRKRFARIKERLHGRIKVIDATEGGMSVAQMESIWENERNRGFAADVVIVDYDDEIIPPRRYKGEGARRFEFADIYRELRTFAARRQLFLWTAAQTRRLKEDQMVVSGEHAAEDISKMRKVAFCLGVGAGPPDWRDKELSKKGLLPLDNARHLHVAAHKFDTQGLHWDIMGDFARGIFYDKEATLRKLAETEERKRRNPEEDD